MNVSVNTLSFIIKKNPFFLDFQCGNSTNKEDCKITFDSCFLYIILGLYLIIYHLLLLNLVIATFT
jgi:hypothetical protein